LQNSLYSKQPMQAQESSQPLLTIPLSTPIPFAKHRQQVLFLASTGVV
jgi:hypothetical protein